MLAFNNSTVIVALIAATASLLIAIFNFFNYIITLFTPKLFYYSLNYILIVALKLSFRENYKY